LRRKKKGREKDIMNQNAGLGGGNNRRRWTSAYVSGGVTHGRLKRNFCHTLTGGNGTVHGESAKENPEKLNVQEFFGDQLHGGKTKRSKRSSMPRL